jgi:phosphoserine aminotransferase
MPQNQSSLIEPTLKPKSPCFGSGPTNKYPGWSPASLSSALAGRSHRSPEGVAQIRRIMDLTRDVLTVPHNYRIALIPGSATGAVEAALWNLLGARGVDVFAWDVFSRLWVRDVVEQLKIQDRCIYEEEAGAIPDLEQYDPNRDLVYVWNGTTAGACIPNHDWIPDNRKGLSICDATSATFMFPVRDWSKIDAYAFSWQKGLGGEGAHGMLILGPRAIDRLQTYIPTWPIPRLLRLTKNHRLIEGLFDEGKIINTPSMLALQDAVNALEWAKSAGGQEGLWRKTQDNFSAMKEWVDNHSELDYLAKDPETISPVSVCLTLKGPVDESVKRIKYVVDELARLGVAYEIKNHYLAPVSFRIWCGPTVDKEDLIRLFPWIDWALAKSREACAS